MALINDDEMTGEKEYQTSININPYDGDRAVSEYFNQPDVQKEIALMADELELLGYSDDPELLGAWLKNLVSRVKTAIQRVKARRSGGGQLSIQLPSATVTPETQAPESSPASGLMKNPLLLWGGAAAAFILITSMMKKK